MIRNRQKPEVSEKIDRESAGNPAIQAISSAVDASPEAFEVEPESTGLELRPAVGPETAVSSRARMKIFSPRLGHTLVFFYKKSLVPYSRDRYSYGGIELRAPEVDGAEVAEWLEFLTSGFHPEKRPVHLRRAFPYEIPE